MTDLGRPGSPFREIDRRQVMVGGALLVASGAAAALRPERGRRRRDGPKLDSLVPRRIGPYRFATATGLIVPSRVEMPTPIYDQVLTRIYVAADRPPVMLLIAYGGAQDADLALHRPEACYPSSGYRLGESGQVPLSGVAGAIATALTATKEGREEQLYFWSRIGRQFPATRFQEKWAVLSSNLTGGAPDGVLVRLSVRSPHRASAVAQMMAFNQLLLGAVAGEGRRLLLGGVAA